METCVTLEDDLQKGCCFVWFHVYVNILELQGDIEETK